MNRRRTEQVIPTSDVITEVFLQIKKKAHCLRTLSGEIEQIQKRKRNTFINREFRHVCLINCY